MAADDDRPGELGYKRGYRSLPWGVRLDEDPVAPYSPRPARTAPVSVPITWDELDDPELRPDRWTIRTVLDRLTEKGDPFRVPLGAAQELPDIT